MSSGATQLPTSQDSVPVLPAPRGRIRLTQASIILPTTNPVSLWQWYINRHSSWLAVQLLVFHTDHLAYKTVWMRCALVSRNLYTCVLLRKAEFVCGHAFHGSRYSLGLRRIILGLYRLIVCMYVCMIRRVRAQSTGAPHDVKAA